jgi:hypothetical protein
LGATSAAAPAIAIPKVAPNLIVFKQNFDAKFGLYGAACMNPSQFSPNKWPLSAEIHTTSLKIPESIGLFKHLFFEHVLHECCHQFFHQNATCNAHFTAQTHIHISYLFISSFHIFDFTFLIALFFSDHIQQARRDGIQPHLRFVSVSHQHVLACKDHTGFGEQISGEQAH